MSCLSGCTEGVSVCRGPISGSVLPAGAGDWWWGAAAARQDRTVNPETVHTEAKGDTGESEDVREACLRREMFWNGSGGIDVAAGRLVVLSFYYRRICWQTIERLCFAIYWCRLTCWRPAAVASNCSFPFKGLEWQYKNQRVSKSPLVLMFW